MGGRWCGQDPAKVPVPGLVLDIEAEPPAVPFQFGPEYWLNARFRGGLGEFDGAVQIIFIG